MDNYFDIREKHRVTDANHNCFESSVLHPNRKMIEHDFIYMKEGEWVIGQENETFHIQKGDVLILGANRYHYGIEPCSPGTKTMYIHTIHNAGDEYDSSENNEKIIIQSHIHAEVNPNVKACFEKVIYAKSRNNYNMASAYLDVLLCELEVCMNQTTLTCLAENMRQMIISSNKLLKNSEIAKSFNICVKTAENIFKTTFHTTIHQYVVDSKIEKAKFYLINFPDMKLYEISENLGFYDEFHMSRHFKKAVGMSPGEYRRRKGKSP